MKQAVIEFKNVSKSFQTWHDRPESLKTVLAQMAKLQFSSSHRDQVTVLENIDLQIHRGDFVGIMGRNGVGKSTLLKLISGIYRPSHGKILTHGRIAPLLELGAGFATELTGYENIFLNASILGFSRDLVRRRLDEIIEFADLKQALDQPVRNYSSGMLVRLGFAVAAHLDAEILLFDEILAVGDVGFQAKCLKKIDELHAEGRTIILVTHTPEQVEKFCTRCIVFNQRHIVQDGSAQDGVRVYNELFAGA
ncbi:MAG: ABC transporter ATP-binding protein [Bdellovibrionaceae bacterium]|nr:ABC transporter ATP-binding protein [Pseudobdellovibrionaceae bacterium]